jgi:hypothetical protein
MKHAGPRALETLEPLLEELRKIAGLVERKRGIFYRGAAPFVHFREDPAGMFADMKSGAGFERYAVNTPAEIARGLRTARAHASPLRSATRHSRQT